MNQRILELALEELGRQKAAIDSEIESIQAELRGSSSAGRVKAVAAVSAPKASAARKAQSERMKKYWAAKRASKKAPVVKGKQRKATNKAISNAMRALWAKRKAEKAAAAKAK
jgi:hypothetical protein